MFLFLRENSLSVPHITNSQQTKTKLAQGYRRSTRCMELFAIVLFFLTELYLFTQVIPDIIQHPFIVFPALLLGYIGADFVSGLVHWIGDTWGNPETPFFGPIFIRPFREHHVDQTAITRHDFIETNGSNCFASILLLLPTILLLRGTYHSFFIIFLLSTITSLTLSIFATNQFHKWAHLLHPPRMIAWLQAKRLILSPMHHARHHRVPYDQYYCITVGWLNVLLEKFHFFRFAEHLITKCTGAIARRNDLELLNTS